MSAELLRAERVACPERYCGAEAGAPCRTATGGARTIPHAARDKAAARAEREAARAAMRDAAVRGAR